MNLDIYWHTFLANKWREIIEEQTHILRQSGLQEAAGGLFVFVVDPDGHFPELASMLCDIDKVHIIGLSKSSEEYEFATLMKLHQDCKQNATDDLALYMHTKGASYPDDRQAPWRAVCHEMLRHWKQCASALNGGNVLQCEVAGANYLPGQPGRWKSHFSGNFWMARRNYIARLSAPVPSEDRFDAEWWVCSGDPKVYSLPFIEHGCKSP